LQVFDSTRKDEKLEKFYKIWTMKGAYVKALGEGLSFPLRDFAVSFKGPQPKLLHGANGQCWSLRNWALDNKCLISVAVEGDAEDFTFFFVGSSKANTLTSALAKTV